MKSTQWVTTTEPVLIHSFPHPKAALRGTLPGGVVVDVAEQRSEWIRIEAGDGHAAGWISLEKTIPA